VSTKTARQLDKEFDEIYTADYIRVLANADEEERLAKYRKIIQNINFKNWNNMRRKTDGIDINIGINLREIRESNNLTQTEVGSVLNITPQQIAKYEAGRNRISASSLYRLACYYDVDIGVFLEITKAVREHHRTVTDKGVNKMKYLEALFNDITNETNKIRRAAWDNNTWIEPSDHGQIKCVYLFDDTGSIEKISVTPYEVGIECTATD